MSLFDLPTKQSRLNQLKQEQENTDFWDNQERATALLKESKGIENIIEEYTTLKHRLIDMEELIALSLEQDILTEVAQETEILDKQINSLHIETLLSGKYDNNNAIITLHSGAGGTEAQDWTQMLYRMYAMYCERRHYRTTQLDFLDGEEAGIKSVTFLVEGEYAYGYLKAEKGVHRLVRLSPFDSNNRRHTSFASVEVIPQIDNSVDLVIDDKELRIDTYRSGGAGGQHVNKTDSAVRITHIPSGIVVACQNERSQIQNRERAMQVLKGKLIELQERKREQEMASIKGDVKKIEWGSQIRSYVFMPYTLVKDHRTGYETANVTAVMDGDIHGFIEDYLSKSS